MGPERMKAVASPTESSLETTFARHRAAFARRPFPNAAERRLNLDRLIRTIVDHQDEITAALDSDFGGRCRAEVRYSEIFVALQSLRHAKRHVKGWMEPRPVPVGMALQRASAWVMPQPLGVVGIVVPWNYPLYLTVGPLAGALAAGNRVMLKLPEFTPSTSSVLARVLAACFDEEDRKSTRLNS